MPVAFVGDLSVLTPTVHPRKLRWSPNYAAACGRAWTALFPAPAHHDFCSSFRHLLTCALEEVENPKAATKGSSIKTSCSRITSAHVGESNTKGNDLLTS